MLVGTVVITVNKQGSHCQHHHLFHPAHVLPSMWALLNRFPNDSRSPLIHVTSFYRWDECDPQNSRKDPILRGTKCWHLTTPSNRLNSVFKDKTDIPRCKKWICSNDVFCPKYEISFLELHWKITSIQLEKHWGWQGGKSSLEIPVLLGAIPSCKFKAVLSTPPPNSFWIHAVVFSSHWVCQKRGWLIKINK